MLYKELLIENTRLKKQIELLNDELRKYREKEIIEFNTIYHNDKKEEFEGSPLDHSKTDADDKILSTHLEETIEANEEIVFQEHHEIMKEQPTEPPKEHRGRKAGCRCRYNFVCLKCRK